MKKAYQEFFFNSKLDARTTQNPWEDHLGIYSSVLQCVAVCCSAGHVTHMKKAYQEFFLNSKLDARTTQNPWEDHLRQPWYIDR